MEVIRVKIWTINILKIQIEKEEFQIDIEIILIKYRMNFAYIFFIQVFG